MELILSNGWFNPEIREPQVFFRYRIGEVKFFRTIDELNGYLSVKEGDYFIILSYDLAGSILGLEIKNSGLPEIIVIEIADLEKTLPESCRCRLELKETSLSDSDFMNRVFKIKELIADGTIYQVNLTNRFDLKLSGDPRCLFFEFNHRQPVPYSFYFNADDFFIISGSMELFLEKKGDLIMTKPIKGTSKSLEALLKSKKDKAENLMITDMMRNDLGRIAKNGSVRVTELFKITEYRTLYQMHSTVEALTEKGFVNIIQATFPPASVTGAPKRKAVEIIDHLEPHPRSYYCGCAGIIRKNRDFILSVLIRTAIGRGNKLSYYAGCGIVWDSIPQKELEELYLKTKAFMQEKPI